MAKGKENDLARENWKQCTCTYGKVDENTVCSPGTQGCSSCNRNDTLDVVWNTGSTRDGYTAFNTTHFWTKSRCDKVQCVAGTKFRGGPVREIVNTC